MRSVRFRMAVACGFTVLLAVSGGPAASGAQADERRSIPSCSPQLVYPAVAGNFDASGAGTAHAARFDVFNRSGALVSSSEATIDWIARAVVDDRGMSVGAAPQLGGDVSLRIETTTGSTITFDATCIAGAGAYDVGPFQGIIVYANGINTGWPGNPNGTSFVHFEAWNAGGGEAVAYVALVEGRDCMLNHDVLAWTPDLALGQGGFTDLPAGFHYSETDCSARFGSPKPAAKAPGLNGG